MIQNLVSVRQYSIVFQQVFIVSLQMLNLGDVIFTDLFLMTRILTERP